MENEADEYSRKSGSRGCENSWQWTGGSWRERVCVVANGGRRSTKDDGETNEAGQASYKDHVWILQFIHFTGQARHLTKAWTPRLRAGAMTRNKQAHLLLAHIQLLASSSESLNYWLAALDPHDLHNSQTRHILTARTQTIVVPATRRQKAIWLPDKS